jgi:hypothetical protein
MGEIKSDQMKNHDYRIMLLPYLYGQYRIQLIKLEGDNIVRECCTYDCLKAVQAMTALRLSDKPEALMEEWATKDNCEAPGARIRLDQ